MTDLTPEPWEVLESRYLLRSPWRNIRVDRIGLHTGAETEYSYFEMHDAALLMAEPIVRAHLATRGG